MHRLNAKEQKKGTRKTMEQTTPETKNIGDANNSGHEHDNTKLFLL